MTDKVLVLGGEGLIGRAVVTLLGSSALSVDITESAEYYLDVFSPLPANRQLLVDLLDGECPMHVVDATYPNPSHHYDRYTATWEYLCKWLSRTYVSQVASLTLLSSIYGIIASDPRLYSGTTIPPTPLWYAFFKGGVISATRHLAVTYPGIRVNCVSPGGVWDGKQSPEFVRNYNRTTPFARMATPQDIAGAVAYLVSPGAGYVTGHNLVVDGGRSIW